MTVSTRLPAISVAVLAGGESSRMGADKALKTLGEKPVISHVIDSLSPLTGDIFIVARNAAAYEHLGLPVCADHYPEKASLVGIYSALAAARNEFCFTVACDMPFVEPALVGLFAGLAEGNEAVVPVSGRGREPLFAVYSKSCLGRLRARIERGDLSAAGALDDLRVRYVELDEMAGICDPEMVFLNVNTVVDLEEAARLFPRVQSGRAGDQSRKGLTVSAGAHGGAPPLVCFVGNKDSGKTTFLEKLLPELGRRGIEVAFIKHDVHGFSMDREGTDTARISKAGARKVMISSPWALASLEKPEAERSLDELYAAASTGVDLVIAEGFKSACADKIEVVRAGNGGPLLCREEELVAVISDGDGPATGAPVLASEDTSAVASLLMIRYGLGRAERRRG